MISPERLYASQAAKSISAEPRSPGMVSTTQEEKLFIIGQVQRCQPVGSAILDAQIAGDTVARAKVVAAVYECLLKSGMSDATSFALAEVAAREVIDSPACKCCKGVGSIDKSKQLLTNQVQQRKLKEEIQGHRWNVSPFAHTNDGSPETGMLMVAEANLSSLEKEAADLKESLASGDIISDCPRCNGVGRQISSKNSIHQQLTELLPINERLSYNTFVKRQYDSYMDVVDSLHQHASKAADAAKHITDQL